jgi:hypothetical protein
MKYLVWLGSALVVLASFGVGGCAATTICEEAVDKLVGECAMGSGASIDDEIGECIDLRQCIAKCINKAACGSITRPVQEGGSYHLCVANCEAEAQP